MVWFNRIRWFDSVFHMLWFLLMSRSRWYGVVWYANALMIIVLFSYKGLTYYRIIHLLS